MINITIFTQGVETMDTRTFEEIAEGQLSIKIIAHNDDESETWNDYEFGTSDELAPNEEIAVFDSRIGSYTRFKNIAEAKAEYDGHVERIKAMVPVIPEWYERLQKKFNRTFITGRLTVGKRSDV